MPPRKGEETEWWLVNFPPLPNPSPARGEGLKKNFDFELPSPPAGEGPGERGEANAGLNQSCCQLCTASLPCFWRHSFSVL